MSNADSFADVLQVYASRAAYTPGQLARLSDVPKSTIVHWLKGHVAQPRDWQPLLRLLAVLRLTRREADEVLAAAGHPPLAQLAQTATASEQSLFQPWQQPATSERRAPFQAIARPPCFVGRRELRQELQAHLRAGEVCTVQGMAGVGKTALAAQLAYDLRHHFADGVLWASPQQSDTATILSTMAQAYGVDISPFPDVDSRSRLVRDLLADRRVLLILDDVARSAQAQPLLPPTGRAAVLITTRRRTLQLAQWGPRWTLEPFSAQGEGSRQLFAHYLGPEQAAAQEESLAQLAQRVGHLPLALSIIAARLAFEPGWSADAFLTRLQQRAEPLQALQAEDQSVSLSFGVSFEALGSRERAFFAALSLFGSHDFAPAAAAAVADEPLPDAQHLLRRLHSLSLLEEAQAGRYRLHPLLADFAAGALQSEPEPAAEDVERRVLAHFDAFLSQEPGDEALHREHQHLLTVLNLTRQREEITLLARLVLALAPFWLRQGFYDLARRHLHPLAQALADGEQRARALLHLGQIAQRQRAFETAEDYLAEARSLAGAAPALQSAVLLEEGVVAGCRGEYEQALGRLRTALPLARKSSNARLAIKVLKELGAACVARGQYAEAAAYYEEGQQLAREHDRRQLSPLLRGLGGVAIVRDKDYARAGGLYEKALALLPARGDRAQRAILLNNLAATAWQAGKRERATSYLQEGLRLAREAQHGPATSMILGNLGRAALQKGDGQVARRQLQEALDLARDADHVELKHTLQQSLNALATAGEHSREASMSRQRLRVFFD